MELSPEEKERIILEEKLRMETRKDFLKDNFGRGHCGWHGGWRHSGCHRCGGGLFKILAVVLILWAVCHFWNRPCWVGTPYYYNYGAPVYPPSPNTAVPPALKK